MAQGVYDIETAGNFSPMEVEGSGKVIRLSERRTVRDYIDGRDADDEVMVLARTVGVERDEEAFEYEADDQRQAEEKRAALILLGAAGVFTVTAVAQAIARGPLPF